MVLLAVAVVLTVPVVHPSTAAAATGPRVVDGGGTVSVSAHEVVLPGAQDDVAGSSAIVPGLTVFPTDQLASLPSGSDVYNHGKTLYYAGFGVWTIADDGAMTFQPGDVTGTRSVRYRITDADGQTAEGLQTVVVTAGAFEEGLSLEQGATGDIYPYGEDVPGRNADGTPGTLDLTAFRFRATQEAGVTVSSDGLDASVPGGVFRIDPTTGLVHFRFELAYLTSPGSVRSLYYLGQDTTRAGDGSVEHHAFVGQVAWVVFPAEHLVVSEDVSPNPYSHVGDRLTFTSEITNSGSTPVDGLTITHSLGTRLSGEACTPVALGATLQPDTTTRCSATARGRQQDFDVDGRRLNDAVVASGTTVVPATAVQVGGTVAVSYRTGTAAFPNIIKGLSVTATTSPSTVSSVGQQIAYAFAVKNRGNRSVRNLVVSSSSRGVSALVCAPVPLGGTLGDGQATTCRATRTVTAADLKAGTLTATVKATAAPVSGAHVTAAGAAARVDVDVTGTPPTVGPVPPAGPAPVVQSDTATTTVGRPVVVDVLANDRPGSSTVPLVGSSVRLRTSDPLPAGSALYGDTKTLTVAGRGVFLVSGTGQITFVPLGTTRGPVSTIGYQVADAAGTTARATLTVTVG